MVATARCVARWRGVPTLRGLRQTSFIGIDELE
jgi:hypothetical protein